MEINDDLYRMLTRDGFVDLFWEKLAALRRLDPTVPPQLVYEHLNARYADFVGEPRFPSYEAFKKYRNRKYKRG